MLLEKILFALLLAPAALATPVPGKEIGVREAGGELESRGDVREEFYVPNFKKLCEGFGYDFSPPHGRDCVTHERFTFVCARGNEHEHPRESFTAQANCLRTHFCQPTSTDPGEENHVADPRYLGNRNIACIRVKVVRSRKVKRGERQAQTPLTDKPAGSSGTMYGTMELTGNVQGSTPLLEWRYVSPQDPGAELSGSKSLDAAETAKKTNLYSIQVNFNQGEQFYADVDYLSPRHGDDIYLNAYMGIFPKPLKFGGGRKAALEEREILADIDVRKIVGSKELEDKEDKETSGE